MKRRVVVTGIGMITPIGNDSKTSWNNAKNGVNGIDKISAYDASEDYVKLAAEIKGFDFESYFGKKEVKRMDRFIQLGLIATDEAIKDSKINFDQIESIVILYPKLVEFPELNKEYLELGKQIHNFIKYVENSWKS